MPYRRFTREIVCLGMAGALSACGGSGSGLSTTPPPPPAPTPAPTPSPSPSPTPTPAPSNTTISNLIADQDFFTLAAGSSEDLHLSDATVLTTVRNDRTITYEYDVSQDSYIVSDGAASTSFGSADIDRTDYPAETVYRKTSGDSVELLTLALRPYSGSRTNRYVGLGYWQRNILTSNVQQTDFDTFVFGLPTAGAAVPNVGNAVYAIDIFGLLATVGEEAKVLSGPGTLHFDLQNGVWETQTTIGEFNLANYNYSSGGLFKFLAAGKISSGKEIVGSFNYSNSLGQNVSGDVTGAFFGPNADEVGAAFSGDTGTSVINGAFTGQADSVTTPRSLTLTNLVRPTIAEGGLSEVLGSIQTDLDPAFRGAYGNTYYERPFTSVRFLESGQVELSFGSSRVATIPQSDLVANGDPAYDNYQTFTDATASNPPLPITVHLYKGGANGGPVELTYSSFGILEQEVSDGVDYTQFVRRFFSYGFETLPGLLELRSGTASYSGIAVGITTDSSGKLMDVDGTSRFVIDFGSSTYSGMLDLTADNEGVPVDLGEFDFSSTLTKGLLDPAFFDYPTQLSQSRQTLNAIAPVFFGPSGEEIIAPFSILMGEPNAIGTTTISGVAAATRD